MKLSKREIVLIIMLVIVAGGMGFFLFWYAPAKARITELNSQIEQKKNEIHEASLRQTQYELFSETIEKSAEEWEESVSGIPTEFDEAKVIRDVGNIVNRYTTDLVIVFPEEAERNEKTEIYPVKISFRAAYNEMITVLGLFEKMGEMRVSDGTFTLDSFIGAEPVLRAVIEAEYLVIASLSSS